MQTLLTVAENLRTNLRDEEERMRQSNKHYDELLNRYENTLKSWSVDKENIQTQRKEIGIYALNFLFVKYVYVVYCVLFLLFEKIEFAVKQKDKFYIIELSQSKHGMKGMQHY